MVSYQTFTSIAFDVADGKNVQFEGIDDGAAFIKQLAAFWNENKQELTQMTEAQVREVMEERVSR